MKTIVTNIKGGGTQDYKDKGLQVERSWTISRKQDASGVKSIYLKSTRFDSYREREEVEIHIQNLCNHPFFTLINGIKAHISGVLQYFMPFFAKN